MYKRAPMKFDPLAVRDILFAALFFVRFVWPALALLAMLALCPTLSVASSTNALERAEGALRRSLVELRKRNREIERLQIDLDTERKKADASRKAHLEQIAILRVEIARKEKPNNAALVGALIAVSVVAVLGVIGAGVIGFELGKRAGGGR